MAQTYGLTALGFVSKQQNTIITEINTLLQGIFGPNANLGPTAVLGQLVGIFSERESLLWQLLEAIYNSENPSSAEGTSVDNILAWNNLRRLGATPTKTAPATTSGVQGLVMYGTAGTVIPINSIISVQGNPSIQFKTNAAYTIAPAANAVQLLSTYGGAPTAGNFALSLVNSGNNICNTELIPWNANAATSQISFSGAPASSGLTFELALTCAGVTLTTAAIACSGGGNYPTAAAIQSAIQALTGYSAVTVTGSAGAYVITWGAIPQPEIAVANNLTGVSIGTIDSIQAAINNMQDPATLLYPFTDVSVSGSFAAYPGGFTITFGANAPATGQAASGSQAQNTFTIPSTGPLANTLTNAIGSVGLNALTTTAGTVALVFGAATCTQTGPIFVAAGALNVIGSPVAGWASVTNPLDCVTGTNLETDTEAMARRATVLAENANGPLQSIVEKVSAVTGVVQAVGFQNVSLAAQQVIAFAGTPASAGFFSLSIQNLLGNQGTGSIAWNADPTLQIFSFSAVPTSGTWTLTLGATTISGIAYNVTAPALQALIQAVPGYSTATVTGSFATEFVIGNNGNPESLLSVNPAGLTPSITTSVVDSIQAKINALNGYSAVTVTGSIASGILTVAFNGSNGGQPQALFVPTNNLTGPSGISVVYGLPGKAVFILVNDNNGEASNTDIAQAIFGSKPGGIMTWPGLASGSPYFGNPFSATVYDAFGNPYLVSWARPNQTPVYVSIQLTTDLTTSPTPKFQPSSIAQIQEDIVEIGTAFGVGGLIIGFGTNGLVGAFNSVPGITGYTLYFGLSPNPTSNTNIPMLNTQQPLFETYLVQVGYH